MNAHEGAKDDVEVCLRDFVIDVVAPASGATEESLASTAVGIGLPPYLLPIVAIRLVLPAATGCRATPRTIASSHLRRRARFILKACPFLLCHPSTSITDT